jgi:hypothetical protein
MQMLFSKTECRLSFSLRKIILERGMGQASSCGSDNGQRGETVTDLNRQIEAMHKRDVLVAWAFVIGLWFAMVFMALAKRSLTAAGAVAD